MVTLAGAAAIGCGPTASVPEQPTWADVAPILRGECASCHGWTASDRLPDATGVHPENTGGSLRLDFYDASADVCGDAGLALDPTVTLAGSPATPPRILADIVPQNGARWPRMPPQPSPALPAWQVETIRRWAVNPVRGPTPDDQRAPRLAVSGLPSRVDRELAFTAILDDPDGDAVLGAVEAGGLAFLMNRSGAFAVRFDASAWPSGPLHPRAVICDGWTRAELDLGPIEIQHQ